jgi:hypothetical protein
MLMQKPLRPISPLFSSYLTSDERKKVRAVSVTDCSSEINLLRVLNARFMEMQSSAPINLKTSIQTLRTHVILSEQLAKLIRVSNLENDPLAELEKGISEALDELRFELNI